MINYIPLLVFLVVGCEGIKSSEPYSKYQPVLEISMDLPTNDDGLYIFDYPNNRPHTYTSVEYISSPMERVFWFSPDSFVVHHMYHYFTEPIINYSTYTSSDSTGKQMIYIYRPHIGDTLSVMGCIQGDFCKEVSFLVVD